MTRRSPASCLLVPLLAGCSLSPERAVHDLGLPEQTNQVLLSTTRGWTDTAATVLCLERDGDSWRRIGDPIAARVGGNGLGWGIGLHVDGSGPKKHEGDKRAPAGVFELGDAFGYATTSPAGVTFAWRQATARDYFVDDSESPAYNRWVRLEEPAPNEPRRHWRSFEHMRRDDMQYEVGMIVGHNTATPVPGRGSAIFLHVWKNPENTTGGCTAMAKDDLLRVMAWLRPEARPLFVQVPDQELARLSCRP